MLRTETAMRQMNPGWVGFKLVWMELQHMQLVSPTLLSEN